MPRSIRRNEDVQRLAPIQLDRWLFREIWKRMQHGAGAKILADDYILEGGDDIADVPHGRVQALEIRSEDPLVVLIVSEGRVELYADGDDADAVILLRDLADLLRSRRRPVAAFINGQVWLWMLLNSLVAAILLLYSLVDEPARKSAVFQFAVVLLSALSILGVVGLCLRHWINRRTAALDLVEQSFLRRNGDSILVGSIMSIIGGVVAVAVAAITR